MSTNKFASIVEKLGAGLQRTYEETIFEHKSDMGDSREQAVIDFLAKVSPGNLGIAKGEVFDEQGGACGQIDVVLYDAANSVVFRDGSGKVFAPVESTHGVIEVKSLLTTGELDSALLKLASYNNLLRPEAKANQFAYTPDSVTTFGVGLTGTGSYNERINGVFAFETNIAVDTLASRLRECACIDFLVIPGKYFFLGRVRKSPHYFVQANGETASHALFSTKDAVTLWTVYLQILLSQSRLIAVDRKKIMGVLLSLQTNLHSATTYSSPKN